MVNVIVKGVITFYIISISISLVCDMLVVGRALTYKFELNPVSQMLITVATSIIPGANLLVVVYDIALLFSTKITFLIKSMRVLSGRYPDDVVQVFNVSTPEELDEVLKKFKPEDGWSVRRIGDDEDDDN